MTTQTMTADADGWCQFAGLPKLDHLVIRVRAGLIDGYPRVTALAVHAVNEAAIGPTELRNLPVNRLAQETWQAWNPDNRHSVKQHPNDIATLEDVAEVWNNAQPGERRQAVEERFYMSSRTAARYVSRARTAGLLQADR